MAGVAGMGTTFNLPNFVGELFAITPLETPFLSAIGGLSGGRQTDTIDFPIGQFWDLPAAELNPSRLEGGAAPAADNRVRTQETNCVEIVHEKVSVSYSKQASTSRLSGLAIVGPQATQPVQDELTFQTMAALGRVARNLNYTLLNGVYARPADNATARKTRGLKAAITTNVTALVGTPALTKTHIRDHMRKMFDNGALLDDSTVFLVNSWLRDALIEAYTSGITDQTILGGVTIDRIHTNQGTFGIMVDRMVPNTELHVVHMAELAPVMMEIPGKGFLFREALAKGGSSDDYQLYGEVGLDYGNQLNHGIITGFLGPA